MTGFAKCLFFALVFALLMPFSVFGAESGTLTFSPTSYNFGNEYVGLVTESKDFVLTSTLSKPVTIESF
jgi:hypothetical protein